MILGFQVSVNTSRGSLIDQAALIAALKSDEIAGAGLDVFENETKPDPELVELDNVVMTPHVGSATHRARYRLTKEASKNITSYLRDGKTLNQVN